MNSRVVLAALVTCFLACAGCLTTATLSPAGEAVNTDPRADVTGCKHLGLVNGQGGGQFGGAWISNDNLMRYAMNDLRNKAAAMGATHVIIAMGSNESSGRGGARHTTQVSGNAYRCPRR